MATRARVDPVTLQIVGNALASMADEMATTICRTAHSTVVRDGMDFSAVVCDAKGRTVAQAVSVPFHLGSIPHAMETLLEHYADRIRPGDVFVMNDPFDGGMHLQDIFVFKPVHLAGELIGFTCTTAHHGDVGGRLPGSSACDNTEIFQEGIRLPWLRLYSEGEPVEDVFKIIEANVRIPRMTFGDLGAQVAACSVAERALVALAERHGREALAELMDALIDYTERLVRQEIATWPDGTASFTDYLGSDGVDVRDVPITAHVTIAGDEITADLTDSSPMVRGSLNSTRSFVQACVYQAVRAALTVEVPNTAGAFRPIHILTKPGTVAEVVMPGASSMRGVTGFRIVDAICGALAQLLPHRVAAAGEGGNTLAIFGAERPGRRSLHLLRARRRHLGRNAGGGRQRRPHEPGEPGREHPGRGGRVRVPDRGRAVRARARLGRRRPPPRRPRDRARLALPDAAHVSDRPLRPGQAPALRPGGRRPRSALGQRLHPPRRDRGDPAADVLDRDRGGRRLRPPDRGRRRLGRSAASAILLRSQRTS